MSREMWKAMETKARKIGVAKTKGRSREEARGETEERKEKTKERK